MPNKAYQAPSYLWYDYETWGVVPSQDRIAQFAAIRTDMDLNIIDDPIDLFCKPACDTVIDPEAVQITGLSPLLLEEKGLSEWDFAHAVYDVMATPNTCTTGYNSIRFDDECSRFLFYRNLLNPYDREWRNGNSRWDLLDVVRMTKALRPDGIRWPVHEDGTASFRLEQLTAMNGIAHTHAHDAVSDVKATIALARLIRDRQPELFDYAFTLRSKHRARAALDLETGKPHLHFSGRIPAREHCMGIEVPLFIHPERANEVIVIDIREDPSWVLEHSAETLRGWLYEKTENLPEGITRPPFKTIHLNRSPMIAPRSLLDEAAAERLGVDRDALNRHYQWVSAHSELNSLALEIFSVHGDRQAPTDPEQALYSGFIDDHDQALLNRLSSGRVAHSKWLDESHALHDDRLPTLIRNVLARHFPDALSEEQAQQWQSERQSILLDSADGNRRTLPGALEKTVALLAGNPDNKALLDTQKYLEQRLQQWTAKTTPENRADPAENFSDNPDSKTDTEPDELNDQLDLF